MASLWTDQAVTAGNIKALNDAFANITGKEDVEKRLFTSNGYNLLFLAIEAKQTKVNGELIDQFQSINFLIQQSIQHRVGLDLKDKKSGQTALHFAVIQNYIVGAKILIENGAYLSTKDIRGRTALHYAAESGNEEMIRLLISSGANIRAKDKMGLNPVKLFKKNFSEPPKALQLTDAQKQYLSSNQLEDNQKKIKEAHQSYLKLLRIFQLTKCKTVKFRNKPKNIFYYITKGNTTMAKQMLRLQPLIANAISNHGQSPLFLACKYGYKEMAQYLLQHNCKVKIRNTFRSTALHVAAQRRHDHIIELLLANQVDIYARDSKGKLAIEYSVSVKDYKSANLMMDQFVANLQSYEKNSESPKWLWILRKACADNQFLLAQKIISNQLVNLNSPTASGWTPLMVAARHGRVEILKLMLEIEEIDVNVASLAGFYPLHVAAFMEDSSNLLPVFKLLLTRGAKPNVATNPQYGGYTPLICLAKRGDEAVPAADYLITNGGDPNIKDHSGYWGCIERAIKNKHHKMVGLLLKHGATIDSRSAFRACVAGDAALVEQFLESPNVDVNFIWKNTLTDEITVSKPQAPSKLSFGGGRGRARGGARGGRVPRTNRKKAVDDENEEENQVQKKKITNESEWSIFGMAILKNLPSFIIAKMLKKGANVNSAEKKAKYSVLHTAVAMGNLETVELLCSHGATVDILTGKGYTPLHLAVMLKYPEIVGTLVKAGADPNIAFPSSKKGLPVQTALKDKTGKILRYLLASGAKIDKSGKLSPMAIAVLEMNPNLFDALLSTGSSVNELIGGWPLLHSIISANGSEQAKIACLKVIFQYGADVNQRNPEERTALHVAVDKQLIHVIKHLLDIPTININLKEKQGWTPLHVAVDKENVSIVKLLFTKNVVKNLETKQGWTIVHMAVLKENIVLLKLFQDVGLNLEVSTQKRGSIMGFAIHRGRWKSAKFLTEAGIKIASDTHSSFNLKSRVWSSLHTAAKNGQIDSIQFFVAMKASLDLQDHHGFTALHVAILRRQVLCVEYLLLHGASVKPVSTFGWNIFHTLAKLKYDKSIEQILKLVSGHLTSNLLQVVDKKGFSPLDIALAQDNAPVAQLYAGSGGIAPIFKYSGFPKEKGFHAVHMIVQRNSYKVIPVLAKFCNINAREDRNGWTPFHFCAITGNYKAAMELASLKADAFILDKHGRSCLYLSVERKKRKVARVLGNYGGQALNNVVYKGRKPTEIATETGKSSMKKTLENATEKVYQQKTWKNAKKKKVRKNKDKIEVEDRPVVSRPPRPRSQITNNNNNNQQQPRQKAARPRMIQQEFRGN